MTGWLGGAGSLGGGGALILARGCFIGWTADAGGRGADLLGAGGLTTSFGLTGFRIIE